MKFSYHFRNWGNSYYWLLVGLLVSSYLINASHRLFLPHMLFQKSVFVQLFLLTMPLLMVYVYLISWGYCFIEKTYMQRNVPYKKIHRVLWGLLAVLLVLVIHVWILNLLVSVATAGKRSVFGSAYFSKDFLFLLVPVVSYGLLAFLWSKARFVHLLTQESKVLVRVEHSFDHWKSWEQYHAPHSLLSYFRKELAATNPAFVRVYDVVLLESVNKSCIAHLASGATVVLHCSWNNICTPMVDDWFVMLKTRYFVNMLYVDLLATHRNHVVLDEEVYACLCHALGAEKLESFLQGNRYFQDRLQDFIDRKSSLPTKDFTKPICSEVSY